MGTRMIRVSCNQIMRDKLSLDYNVTLLLFPGLEASKMYRQVPTGISDAGNVSPARPKGKKTDLFGWPRQILQERI